MHALGRLPASAKDGPSWKKALRSAEGKEGWPRRALKPAPLDARSGGAAEEEDELMEELLSDVLSRDKLWRLCGTRDLDGVTELELSVDADRMSLDSLGHFLPSLARLCLARSALPSVRLLGTSLSLLQVLRCPSCGLVELSGVCALPRLRDLDVSDNAVCDLTPLATHDNLQILDLSRNRVRELAELEVLGTCGVLYELSIAGNPICAAGDALRSAASAFVPQLRVMDGRPLSLQEMRGLRPDQLSALAAEALLLRAPGDPEDRPSPKAAAAPSPPPRRFGQLDALHRGSVPDTGSELTQGGVVFAGGLRASLRRKGAPAAPAAAAGAGLAWLEEGVIANPSHRPRSAAAAPEGRRGGARPPRPKTAAACRPSSCAPRGAANGAPVGERLAALLPRPVALEARPAAGDEAQARSAQRPRLDAQRRARRRKKRQALLCSSSSSGSSSSGSGSGSGSEASASERRATLLGDEAAPAWAVAKSRRGVEGAGGDRPLTPRSASLRCCPSGGSASDSEEERGQARRRRRATAAGASGRRLGFDLQSSLQAIDVWSAKMDGMDDGNAFAHRADILFRGRREAEAGAGVYPSGAALRMKDAELVELLRQPPKRVQELRTRESFRRFFAHMPEGRMAALLTEAYADRGEEERARRVAKRLGLVRDVLS